MAERIVHNATTAEPSPARDRAPITRIQAAIVDSGGVLSSGTFGAISADIRTTLGVSNKAFTRAWGKIYPRHGTGETDEAEFWREFQQETGLPSLTLPEGPSLLARAYDDNYTPNTDVRDIVGQLKTANGVHLALLSNSWPALEEVEEKRGTFREFDEVHYSHRIGVRKPDKRAFEHVLKSFRTSSLITSPAEVVFIDDKARNVAAASELGINGIVYERGKTEQLVDNLRQLGLNIHVR